jgi:ABC-type transport system involved in multi-copper enzyme maturation permease subunit
LALVCSNKIARGSIILGKYLGAILTLMVPLLVGMLINIIIINFLGKVNLDAKMAARIGFISLVGLTYLSVFVFLGLFISSVTHRTPTSLLLSLSVWLILVVVIPTLAGMAGEHLTNAPKEAKFAQRQEEIYQIWRNPSYGQKLLQEIARNRRLTETAEIQREAIRLLTIATDEKIKLNQDIWHAVESKENLARNLARVSPASAFQFACESLAFTGITGERSFYRAAQNFVSVYRDYIKEKTGVAYEFHLSTHPWKIEVPGKTLSISTPIQPKLKGELRDLPQFKELYPSISDSFRHSVLDIALLILWNILLFLLSNLLFIRYDVRSMA